MARLDIREAVAADLDAIAGIWAEIVSDPVITFTTQEPRAENLLNDIAAGSADKGACFLVLEIDGEVGGFATWGAFRKGPGYRLCAEHSVHLGANARGVGGGRLLMAALMDRAKNAGLRFLVAGISGQNKVGLSFHEALGFVEVGRLPDVGYKLGQHLDLVLMQKDLNDPQSGEAG